MRSIFVYNREFILTMINEMINIAAREILLEKNEIQLLNMINIGSFLNFWVKI
jgi:hypothetical protein